MMKTSEAGIAKIAEREGYRDMAYPDPATGGDPWTIGHGTTCYPNGFRVKPGDRCTSMQALGFLHNDVADAEREIGKMVKAPLTQNQYDALVSFVYNVGSGSFEGSTLLKRLNQRDYDGAARQFLVWNKARIGGVLKVVPGLTARRAAEREQFQA